MASHSANADWVRALQRTAAIQRTDKRTLASIVDERAAATPDQPALEGCGRVLTYAALADLIRRVAAWAADRGLCRGDRVALIMDNQPEYPALWLGLSRLGIVTALINTQLTGEALRHCLAESAATLVIADPAHAAAVSGISPDTWVFAAGATQPTGGRSLDDALAADLPMPVDADLTLAAPALLVFTSGTTGLPKAAFVSHYRIVMWSEWFAGIADTQATDRLFNCLPMYHSIGGVVAVGSMLVAGAAVIVRSGFSASRFWSDVGASGATLFQYIGELCRYLAAAPAGAGEQSHSLRLAIGNGLRAEVWPVFIERFAIPRVIEFYAATEGSFSLFNLEGRVGAIGRIPGFMAHRSPVALVRHDPATEQPMRDADERCIRCASGEVGEAIGRLGSGTSGLADAFEGYTRSEANEAKVLRDVFEPGDAWYRTGDLMKRDAEGFFFFVDRIGDTFRWKGENVATAEVADVLAAMPGLRDGTVYGVRVPGADGRAGMAAIVAEPTVDLAALHALFAERLPRYARPLIVRLRNSLEATGTFRQRKSDLVAEGCDPSVVADPLYFDLDGSFVPLTPPLYAEIAAGRIRL